MKRLSTCVLIGVVLAIGVSTASAEDTNRQFGRCEMDAIKNLGHEQDVWYSPAGRYLYACMRASGYDLIFPRKPDGTPDLDSESRCKFGDMRRIMMPECYEPYGDSRAKQFGLCEMDAIKNMGYEQGDYDGPAGRYLYACMLAAGYGLKSQKPNKATAQPEISGSLLYRNAMNPCGKFGNATYMQPKPK